MHITFVDNILSNLILSKLTPYAEEIIGDHHRGFRRNRSTTHLVFCIRQMLEKKWEFSKAMHQLFTDLKKKNPTIPVGEGFCIIFSMSFVSP